MHLIAVSYGVPVLCQASKQIGEASCAVSTGLEATTRRLTVAVDLPSLEVKLH